MAAVGTNTITHSYSGGARGIDKITFAWTSSAGGAVSGTLTGLEQGIIARVVFIPGTSGVQPDDLYDVTLLDANAMDVLAGQGGNLSHSTMSHVVPGCPLKDGTTTSTTPIYVCDTLELQVANAGNAKQGTVVLYLDKR